MRENAVKTPSEKTIRRGKWLHFLSHFSFGAIAIVSVSLGMGTSKACANTSQNDLERRVLAVRARVQELSNTDTSTEALKGLEETRKEIKLTQYWSNWPNWPNWPNSGGGPNWPNWGKWFNR